MADSAAKMFIGIVSTINLLLLHISNAEHKVPVFYLFGDSLVDSGNNYYLNTRAKSYFPNGIDFGGPIPSGRLTNGRTLPDIIEQELGLKSFTPPFLAPTTNGEIILHGVNYASSTAGIFDNTSSAYGEILSFDRQISCFEKTRQDTISLIGAPDARKQFREAVYYVGFGSNEIRVWEKLSLEQTWGSLDVYLKTAMSKFKSQLKRLYDMGGRKFIVTNCGPIGCIPNEKYIHPTIGGCVGFRNKQANSYNIRLKKLLQELTATLEGSVFVYADIYATSENIIQSYKSYGFKNADLACCGIPGIYTENTCKFFVPYCTNRSEYVFWDAFHFTDKSNQIIAKSLLDGGSNYISPMNIRQLLNHSAT